MAASLAARTAIVVEMESVSEPQVVGVRGRKFFVCDYTGALIEHRFYVPLGKQGRIRSGAWVTLPVLLRDAFERAGSHITPEWDALKKKLEDHFGQPNIPMAPALPIDAVPLTPEQLRAYLGQIEQGEAWVRVEGREQVGDTVEVRPAKKPKKTRRS